MARRRQDADASLARRRSRRMFMSERIHVRGKGADGKRFEEQTNTVTVNAHGALLLLEVPVRIGQALSLVHRMTQEEMEAQVVYIGSKQGGKTKVAIQFSKPAPHFWRVMFPPDDWLSPETDSASVGSK